MGEKIEKNKKILAIVLVIAVLLLGIYKIFFEKKENNDEVIDTQTISVVKDSNRFFTVSSCVSKYISYLSTKDNKNLLILLSKEYKNNNSVNSDNLYDFIGTIDSNKTFSPKKMFEQRISKNIYKYYVYGLIEEDFLNSESSKQGYYLIVILNERDMTFAIEPYDGALFK